MAISSELEQLLASWIPRQPWFPKLAADFGTDPDITPMSVARAFTYKAEELGGFAGLVTVISVGDGPTLRRLNIPLSLRGTEDIHLRHALVGQIDDLALGHVFVYDGAADPVFVNLMADAITKRKVFDGGQLSTESLRHSRDKEANRDRPSTPMPFPVNAGGSGANSDAPAEVVPPKPSKAALVTDAQEELPVEVRPIEVADSGAHKSTVIIHDEYEPLELSFFRVLENGMPSSLTIPVLLTEAGSRSVPEVIGWGSGRWYDMFEVTEMEAPMALLSHVDVEAEPAWREAVDIVCAVDSGSIGAYNAQAAEMGRRIGELHSDMAAEFGIVEGTGEPTKLLVKKWIERIDWALGRAPLALDSLVPELRAHRAKLQSLETIGVLQKIHGELTLDHVVSSPSDGYSVVKFTDSTNSDPKPVALDLVALLRSIDYAAGFARLQRTEELDSEDGGLVVNGFGNDPGALRAIYDSPEYLWASQVQNSLLSGYSRARGESLGLGDPVLRAALIDRLLVEVVTELRNRPNWLSVPLSTLTLVLKGKPARSGDVPAEVELTVPAVADHEAESEEASTEVEVGDVPTAAAAPTDAVVDGVSSEPVEPTDGSIAEVDSDTADFKEPNVEAPADGAAFNDTENDSEPSASASGSVSPLTVSSETDGHRRAEEVKITGGVSRAETLVDGVTAEAVEPVEPVTTDVATDIDADTAADADADADADTDADVDAEETSGETSVGDESVAESKQSTAGDEKLAGEDEEPAADNVQVDEDKEFVEEDEEEVVVHRVPASFAARGATSEDADSTGHEGHSTKPTNSGSVFGEYSDSAKNRKKH